MKAHVLTVCCFMAAAVLFFNSACSFTIANGKTIFPSKKYVTKTITVTHVTAITASASVNVFYYQTPGNPRVEIYAPDNILPYVKVSVTNGKLEAGMKMKNGESIKWGDSKCEVRVYAPEVTSFSASSSADIKLATALNTGKDVFLHASSSGDVNGGALTCGGLNIAASSSGDVKLSDVTCNKVELNASSSGDIDLNRLNGKSLSASCSSSGDCTIGILTCSADMDIRTSSSGDCEIKSVTCVGDINAVASTSGDVILKSGSCRNAMFSASTSSNVTADNVKASDIEASASTGGEVACQPSGVLTVKISSGGKVGYKGNPTYISGDAKKVSRL